MTVGERIKEYRKLRGLSQVELAELIHVSQRTISSWEVGRTEPNMGAIEMLSAVLSCRKTDLIGDDATPQKLTDEEIRLISLFRLLGKDEQDMIFNVIETAVKRRYKL